MNESSLLSEYQKLHPGVKKIFVLPQIPDHNQNTSYLFRLYKDLLTKSSTIEVVSFNASSLPRIFVSRLKSERSILHYHWFEFGDLRSFIGIKWKFFWIILYKLFGGKIIWTVHNFYPHHNKYLFINKKIRRLLAKLSNRLHIHCGSEIETVAQILNVKKQKFFIVKHPDFTANIFEKSLAVDKLNRKYFSNKLKTDDRIFLMFGAIAAYKGLKEVIEIFNAFEGKNKLIIAGFIKKGNLEYFAELKSASNSKNIFLQGITIPDEDIPDFLNSADYLIFNYKNILTSGGIILAMNYKKKIIAPALGCIKEINYPALIKFNRKDITLEQVLHSL